MPMYEYRCANCGRLYEQLRRMSEADEGLRCPYCESDDVKRQVSACAVRSSGGAGCGSGSGGRGFT
ncbi:MAG TPA: zinc ribbon domain-containing protein [Bryobacteraceae bacterium]|nr:zinc ribbon domain-containing protein [Bryobacteraceae bacterium]